MSGQSLFARKQVAARRVLFDGRGHLNADARVLAAELKKLCRVGKPQLPSTQNGIDPLAVAALAARREIWDHFVTLLQLDPYTVVNLREDDNG